MACLETLYVTRRGIRSLVADQNLVSAEVEFSIEFIAEHALWKLRDFRRV